MSRRALVLLLSLVMAALAWSQPLMGPAGPDDVDKSVAPTVDFFQYANGPWMAANPCPPEYPKWGRFAQLADRNLKDLHTILVDLSTQEQPEGSLERKLADLYLSGMATENDGLQAMAPVFQQIDAIKTPADLTNVVSMLHLHNMTVLFQFYSDVDARNSTRVIGAIYQGGLGLPEREYYLKQDDKSKTLRTQYVAAVARMLTVSGTPESEAKRQAERIMALETRLARACWPIADLRDPQKTYNLQSFQKLAQTAPAFGWLTYAKHRNIVNAPLNVGTPSYFVGLNEILKTTPMADIKAYLRWHTLGSMAPYMPPAIEEARFDFFDRTLRGTKAMKPRWKRVVEATSTAMGEGLGKLYCARYFPTEAKAKVKAMVANIKAELADRLKQVDWMGDATRTQALAKLNTFVDKIGYPDKWRDYSSLKITRSFAANMWAAREFEIRRDINKIGKPVDRSEWFMPPQTVNAYYNPAWNEIVFPAGILQPPFFHLEADDAYNYGGIGMVIGHEITHGFDDAGSQYDADGNLRNWWTEEDLKRFQQRTKAIETQFGNYEVDGQKLNGKLVTGESLADLGGLALAYGGYLRSLKGQPAPVLSGFTGPQRFFLGFAHIWATNATPEFLQVQIATDPHPPARFRVNGPLSNFRPFAEAFGGRIGEGMMRPESELIQLW